MKHVKLFEQFIEEGSHQITNPVILAAIRAGSLEKFKTDLEELKKTDKYNDEFFDAMHKLSLPLNLDNPLELIYDRVEELGAKNESHDEEITVGCTVEFDDYWTTGSMKKAQGEVIDKDDNKNAFIVKLANGEQISIAKDTVRMVKCAPVEESYDPKGEDATEIKRLANLILKDIESTDDIQLGWIAEHAQKILDVINNMKK